MNDELRDKLIEFFSNYKKITYQKGDVIIRGQDTPSGVYFVRNGYVKMSSIFEDGTEIAFNIFKPQSYFPMIWALTDMDNVYFYKALSKVEVFRAPKEDVVIFLQSNPKILQDLTTRLLIGLDGVISTTKNIIKSNSLKKVALIIVMLGKRFGNINADNYIEIDVDLTHQDIANFSGISRETTSIAIEKLRNKNLLSVRGKKFIINNIQELENVNNH
jgi:CRP/FNR family transcriptional regulator